MQDKLIEIARSLEAAALNPQADHGVLPFEPAVTSALLRSRRLRVLDWLAQSGLSVVNILSGAEPAFLQLAETCDISDKYSTARLFYDRIAPHLSPWMDQVARLEVLLIEARRPRPQVYPPLREADPAYLIREAIIDQIDLSAAIEIHQKIPSYDVPQEVRLNFRAMVERRPNLPQPILVLAAGPNTDVDGIVGSIEPIVAELLCNGGAQFTWGALRMRLGSETADSLREHQLITTEARHLA
jgi:hypothetical protein